MASQALCAAKYGTDTATGDITLTIRPGIKRVSASYDLRAPRAFASLDGKYAAR